MTGRHTINRCKLTSVGQVVFEQYPHELVMPMFHSWISSSSLETLSKAFRKSKCMISMVEAAFWYSVTIMGNGWKD